MTPKKLRLILYIIAIIAGLAIDTELGLILIGFFIIQIICDLLNIE